MKVYITGVGIITAIGNNATECLESLKSEKTGVGPITLLESKQSKKYLAGEIKLTNTQLAKNINIKKTTYPRSTLLGLTAAKEAFNHAKIDVNDGYRSGVISGTTVGGMDKSEKFFRNLEQESDFIHSHSCGYTTEEIADFLEIDDYVASVSTACSTSANAILIGTRLIKAGIVDRVVAGGADSLSKFTLNGFNTLMILSTGHCKPFDKNRKGLNLGEGAGFVVLESEEIVKKQNKKPLAEVKGYANANDAYHQTATSENAEGLYRCMSNALKCAGLNPEDIEYICPHGTGTENNDITESVAIKRVFGEHVPPFSSSKSYTGHTLGAAGGISAVFSVMSVMNNFVFSHLNFDEPIPETGLIPQLKFKECEVNNAMSNSFGFGGNDTSLIFSKVNS